MNEDWKDRPWSLREQPPVWPWDDNEDDTLDSHAQRSVECFEAPGTGEMYAGASVMDDLTEACDETTSIRILARYTVVRLLILSGSGCVGGAELRVERRVALQHLGLLPAYDWERSALERLAGLCRETPAPLIIGVAVTAAEAAAKRGHSMGAFALYRAAFELARGRAWWAPAASAAHGAARLAQLNEAYYSARLWERRARVLDRRVARQIAAAATAGNKVRGRTDGET